jgi:L-Ala-D/L-Glu epimerase
MKIKQIEIYQSPIKLKEPFVISLGTMEFADNLIVIIKSDSGIIGYGECSPFLPINGESMETGFIIGQYLAKQLLGQNPLDIEGCTSLMDKIIVGNTSIKSAFDIALYDIASQHAGLPLYRFLGGKNNKTLITDYTVSIGEPKKMGEDALKIKERGFQIIKVKLGKTGSKDVERIKAIRRAIGNEIPLRIDANQGWSISEAISTLQALAPYAIQHCEEPIPKWNFMELHRIKEASPIPVMADESCFDQHDAKRLIDLSACDSFNIKLGKTSGIFKALKIIELAEKAKMPLQVGGFLESRLGFTASAHLALVSESIIHFDFDTPLMFIEDPIIGGITYDDKGVITMPEVPGLGASVAKPHLEKLIKVIIK